MEKKIRKAMIFAAGLGERLKPLTLSIPKPLIEVSHIPLILYNLSLLKKFGICEVWINLFHLGNQIVSRLGDGKQWGMTIHYSKEEELLGTGGGLKKLEDVFLKEENFLVLNADIIIDINLEKLIEAQLSSTRLATLALSPQIREDVKRKVFSDLNKQIQAISEEPPHENLSPSIFTGLQVLNSRIFNYLPSAKQKSCLVTNGYIPALSSNKEEDKLYAFIHSGYYQDVGSFERYKGVCKDFSKAWPLENLKSEDLLE